MPTDHKEIAFESAVENYLLNKAGYSKGDRSTFDQQFCIDKILVLSFIKETQLKEWKYLENILKNKAEEALLDCLFRALNSEYEGCLMVLREGFKCYGKLFKVAYFKPASGLNPETQNLYNSNKLTVTRQLSYSNKHKNGVRTGRF